MFEKGVRSGIDPKIAMEASPYITIEPCDQSIHEVFISSVESNRSMPGWERKPAILFLDNARAHWSQRFIEEMARLRGLVVSYPSHTSLMFLVLGRLLFGRLKAAKRHLVRDLEESVQLDHAVRMFKGYELATTGMTIRASFEQTGFDYVQRDEVWSLIVNEDRFRRYPEFEEVGEADHPEESLSQRTEHEL
jgi:hypothetical protein